MSFANGVILSENVLRKYKMLKWVANNTLAYPSDV